MKNYVPSPEAYALMQYEAIPVSTYTGVPSVNIPIYTIQVGNYSLPISLNYHASGIKVAQEASWVGLGWSLSADLFVEMMTNFITQIIPTRFL